ncbi:heavy metal transport/detoxification protein [bacterium]|nr:MAG: heavy metal transport/detoxification protein [bacterium]
MNLFSRKTASAEKQLKIEGMNCGACQSHVTKALQSVPGVKSVSVDYRKGSASISGDAEVSALVQAVEKAGYSVVSG